MVYPANFLRGISDSNYLTPDNTVSGAAFHFDKKHCVGDWIENSINWEDDAGAVVTLFSQKNKKGLPQFRAGAILGPISCLDEIKALTNGILSYERKQLENNPYHGNLLLKKNTHKYDMENVSGMIATYCNCMGHYIPFNEI
jgi:hypothetical protein